MTSSRDSYKTGRIKLSRSKPSVIRQVKRGQQPLHLDAQKDGLLYIPTSYDPARPSPMAVMLHGSGADPQQGVRLLQQYADTHNLIIVAPASRKYTWDIITNDSFGADVIFIEQAIRFAFANYVIDAAHVAVGGFSDGASYALCLGLTNGDLFTHIIAFSPGFSFTHQTHGKPSVFISHGTQDPVLPIGPCGRRVHRQLQQQGLQVVYLEFEGEHEIPANISKDAVEWFVGKKQM